MERSGSAWSEPLSMQLTALLFELAGQRFAVALAEVLELTRACAVQPLPKGPTPVLGVLNLRGTIVTVLGLRQRFELPEKKLEPSDFFVFMRVAERRVALCVDRVLGIEQLQFSPLSAAPGLPARIDYLSGVAAVAEGVQLIYDLAQFLSSDEVVQLDRALSERLSEVHP
jgi:purine-binding chemotaxis protein CheW